MINHASKLLIKDTTTDTYLVVYRANHPYFGNAIDLPGGAVEKGETGLEATIREVDEETKIDASDFEFKEVYSGRDYSLLTKYTLFYSEVAATLPVTVSWEHSHVAWVSKDQLIRESRASNDSFMHLVADQLQKMI